jgi:hypothetical protein
MNGNSEMKQMPEKYRKHCSKQKVRHGVHNFIYVRSILYKYRLLEDIIKTHAKLENKFHKNDNELNSVISADHQLMKL